MSYSTEKNYNKTKLNWNKTELHEGTVVFNEAYFSSNAQNIDDLSISSAGNCCIATASRLASRLQTSCELVVRASIWSAAVCSLQSENARAFCFVLHEQEQGTVKSK